MGTARVQLPEKLELLTAQEWENLIQSLPVSEENKIIARMRFISEECLEDISEAVGYNRKTISQRLVHIMGKIEKIRKAKH
jgi:hypothetical protein